MSRRKKSMKTSRGFSRPSCSLRLFRLQLSLRRMGFPRLDAAIAFPDRPRPSLLERSSFPFDCSFGIPRIGLVSLLTTFSLLYSPLFRSILDTNKNYDLTNSN